MQKFCDLKPTLFFPCVVDSFLITTSIWNGQKITSYLFTMDVLYLCNSLLLIPFHSCFNVENLQYPNFIFLYP